MNLGLHPKPASPRIYLQASNLAERNWAIRTLTDHKRAMPTAFLNVAMIKRCGETHELQVTQHNRGFTVDGQRVH
jgi:hypothetical protein